jgi:hypothetical protein
MARRWQDARSMSEKQRQKKDGARADTAAQRSRAVRGRHARVQRAVVPSSARDTSNFTDAEPGASDRVRARKPPRPAATRTRSSGLSRKALASSAPRAARSRAGKGGKGK